MADNSTGQQGGQNNKPKTSGLSWSQPSSTAKPSQTGSSSSNSNSKITPALKSSASTTGQQGGSGRKTFLLFVGGIVVGGLLAWSWFSITSGPVANDGTSDSMTAEDTMGTDTSTSGTNSDTSAPASPSTSPSGSSLVVPSPQSAGLSVSVTSATVSSPTWVVVYETQNGVRGNALGAALFFPNGTAHTVNLLRATEPNKTYFVGRQIDNGDKQFSLADDQPVVNAAGNPVYVEFKTE